MIGLIQGQVHHLMAPTVVVMTPAGVGYEIEMPLNAFCQVQLNQSVTLWTHFLVREDAQLLFGFLSHSDREVFRLLLKVNGVGAKMALAMMSTVTVQELHQFVMNNDELALTRIPGVGKKTAQRLIVLDVSKFLTLSEEGKRIAEETYARHTFFSDMLQNIGVPKNIATEDACRIEHVISQETFEAIKKYYQNNKD